MAEGYLRELGKSHVFVQSAGLETHGVNPTATQVMQEEGIDISHHTSNNINEFLDMSWDHIITVCDNANENCPYFPNQAVRHHRDFIDPAAAIGSDEEILMTFRSVRDEIKKYCVQFLDIQLDTIRDR